MNEQMLETENQFLCMRNLRGILHHSSLSAAFSVKQLGLKSLPPVANSCSVPPIPPGASEAGILEYPCPLHTLFEDAKKNRIVLTCSMKLCKICRPACQLAASLTTFDTAAWWTFSPTVWKNKKT